MVGGWLADCSEKGYQVTVSVKEQKLLTALHVCSEIVVKLPLSDEEGVLYTSLTDLYYRMLPHDFAWLSNDFIVVKYASKGWQSYIVDDWESWDVLVYCDPLQFAVAQYREKAT